MGYECFPPEIEKDLLNIATGMGSSVAIEYLHRELAVHTRHANNSTISRTSRWHRAHFSGVLPDQDRRQVVPTEEDRNKSKELKLNKASYEMKKETHFSLGAEVLAEIESTKEFHCEN